MSFDFSQSLRYPYSPLQVGSEYFASTRKCDLFGIHDERNEEQVNYLIDEGDSIGKGPNAVISLLHHYIESRPRVNTLVLFADNCVGQNKNNAMIQYLQWRTRTGRNARIFYNFLAVGHTKFAPDRGFSIVKKEYRRSYVDNMDDIGESIQRSSPNNLNSSVQTYYVQTKTRNVYWRDWVRFLGPIFKSLPKITKFHHFYFSSTEFCTAREWADSEPVTHYLQKVGANFDVDELPNEIQPDPLPEKRQWQLYSTVRSLVIDENKKDDVAPRPLSDKVNSSNKNKRLCLDPSS